MESTIPQTPTEALGNADPLEAPYPVLSPVEARVLGCLIEKELATPEVYPLTLNSLVNACNQKNNRHPVMALDEGDVSQALENLRRHHLAALFSGADARVAKFKQTVDAAIPMETADRVVLCELLVRGPQTPGELRTRCSRLHPFESLAAIEAALARLSQRPAGPLVASLPRQPGQKEARYAQLLSGSVPETGVAPVQGKPIPNPPNDIAARLAALETEVADLRSVVEQLRRELGG